MLLWDTWLDALISEGEFLFMELQLDYNILERLNDRCTSLLGLSGRVTKSKWGSSFISFFLGELFHELVKSDNILQWSIIFHGHCHKFLNMRLANADIQHINRVAWNSPWNLYYKLVNYGSEDKHSSSFSLAPVNNRKK